MTNEIVIPSAAIRQFLGDNDTASHGQKRGVHEVGLGLARSAINTMGWSFLVSMFGPNGMNSNVIDALKILTYGGIAEVGRRLCNWAFERFRFHYSITAQFDEGDPSYEWIVNYLTQQNVWHHSRDFFVSAKSSKIKWGIKLRPTDSAEYVPKYERPHLFRWRGYWVEIQRKEQATVAPTLTFMHEATVVQSSSLTLTIYTLNINVLSEMIEEARLHYVEGRRPHVIIHSIDTEDGVVWNIVKRKNRRSLESIILPDGLLNTIVKDVKEFIRTEEWYMKAGIPYRRGYLLYGPPGTGKTSTIYALAGELGLEIYTLSLSPGSISDNDLQRAVSALPKHSILLLEDVDCAFLSREDDKENIDLNIPPWARGFGRKPQITMSGLFNVLDGVGSEDGRLFFATTNYIDRLDPALIRPGRVDMKIQYKMSTRGQVLALFNRIYTQRSDENDNLEGDMKFDAFISDLAESFASTIPESEFTTAELQGYLLAHRQDPEKAVQGVQEWVEMERAERERRRIALEEEKEKRKEKEKEKSSASRAQSGSSV